MDAESDNEGIVNVEECLRQIPSLADSSVIKIEHISGGLTNDNVVLTLTTGRRVMLRRFKSSTTTLLGYDREAEATCAVRAHEVGVGPMVLGAVPAGEGAGGRQHGGALALEFIVGHTMDNNLVRDSLASAEGSLVGVVATIKRLHSGHHNADSSSTDTIPGTFDPPVAQKRYAEGVGKLKHDKTEIWPGYDQIMHRVAPIFEAVKRCQERKVPCHNDLLAANFILKVGIKKEEDKSKSPIAIIDYELAAMAEPCWELGNFISECELDDTSDIFQKVAQLYFTELKGDEIALRGKASRIEAFCLISKLTWAAWGALMHLQTRSNSLSEDFSFETWSLERVRKAATYLQNGERVETLLSGLTL